MGHALIDREVAFHEDAVSRTASARPTADTRGCRRVALATQP